MCRRKGADPMGGLMSQAGKTCGVAHAQVCVRMCERGGKAWAGTACTLGVKVRFTSKTGAAVDRRNNCAGRHRLDALWPTICGTSLWVAGAKIGSAAGSSMQPSPPTIAVQPSSMWHTAGSRHLGHRLECSGVM